MTAAMNAANERANEIFRQEAISVRPASVGVLFYKCIAVLVVHVSGGCHGTTASFCLSSNVSMRPSDHSSQAACLYS